MNLLVLALAFLVQVNAQSIVADAQSQSLSPNGDDQLVLTPLGAPTTFLPIQLANLTTSAVSKVGGSAVLRATPLFIDSTTQNKLSSTNFALIQCDESAYPGYSSALDLVQQALLKNPKAVVLYSNTSSFCRLQSPDATLGGAIIYTMTDSTAWSRAQAPMQFTQNSAWIIARKTTADNSSQIGSQNYNGTNPGGPSPSTAVAMIILYSITGVITALFLVIIITGAIRAHRHPERYGPRNVLGRPRQSRARGLARAMLDTLPIVKFGEKDEPVKPGDVELGSSSAAAGAGPREGGDGIAAVGTEHANDGTPIIEESDASAGAEADSKDITAAGAAAKQVQHDPQPHAADEDNSLGCSICTEDFERGQDVRVLPCNHSFHPACIDPWLLNVSGTCPLCRIDLRPTTSHNAEPSNGLSHDSANSHLPPPLDSGETSDSTSNNRSSRRLSGFWEILNPRRMEEATPQERIAALRRVHEQRAATSPSEEIENRRRRRLTARLGDTFGIRTRPREPSPNSIEESTAAEAIEETPASTTNAVRGPSAP